MTNTELIQAIRKEIEKIASRAMNEEGQDLCEYLLSFISTLEKSEKPMDQEDIDTEIGHWMDRLDDKYCLLVPHYSIQDIKDTARHFAEWGVEHLKK